MTGMAHNATDDVGRAYGQWLATPDEIEHASEGAAGILTRRLPPGAGNPDVADLVRVGVAVVSYVSRQWRTLRDARAQRRRAVLDAAEQPAEA